MSKTRRRRVAQAKGRLYWHTQFCFTQFCFISQFCLTVFEPWKWNKIETKRILMQEFCIYTFLESFCRKIIKEFGVCCENNTVLITKYALYCTNYTVLIKHYNSSEVNNLTSKLIRFFKCEAIFLKRQFPMRQIWSLRSDCTRLRAQRMSWVVSKGRGTVFYHWSKLEHKSNQMYTHNWNQTPSITNFTTFFDFESGFCETEMS